MPTLLTYLSVVISFFSTLFILPYWIRRAREHHLLLVDVHKGDKREVPGLGGLIVVFGIVMGVMAYTALHTFYYHNQKHALVLFAATSSILLSALIGLVDDLLGRKIGLRQYQKPLLTLFVALPMMVINAGTSLVTLPFVGPINLGLWYPLLFIPGGIIGASNAFNMIAGMNGLEAGMGLIITATLGTISYDSGNIPGAILSACVFFAILAFWVYNKYPARIFPGNTFTYAIGTSIALIAILGDIEKYALFMFIPYYLEFLLKLRGLMQKETLVNVNKDGTLVHRYRKWYSLPHVVMSGLLTLGIKPKEWAVVFIIHACTLLLATAVLAMYYFT
ncbi:glycosyl transferase family 4 [Candidatus Woesearchaeota archaeon]|nr:glycosyl transferase family 4 [Candidatus Woesearchaeota archaeon]